jgi:endogenous inhibitor of DNA gyrase (YacG/DUF329 family)
MEEIELNIPYSYTKEYKLEYYQKNKDKISKANSTQVTCPVCNKNVTKQRLFRHRQTAGCQNAQLLKDQSEIHKLKNDIDEMKENQKSFILDKNNIDALVKLLKEDHALTIIS